MKSCADEVSYADRVLWKDSSKILLDVFQFLFRGGVTKSWILFEFVPCKMRLEEPSSHSTKFKLNHWVILPMTLEHRNFLNILEVNLLEEGKPSGEGNYPA